ncbi:hypothetical protein KV112_09480 [Mycolicibacter sp. MYC123]|uniref:PE-PGRS family protein n=1 Tax=[Mycobacterium] zoologicum TaxID=2872311 RepID=A0ABU5YKG2_9MYCO|nr:MULTISPECIES: hypothetical protein [unclassified Mycolicibacter]MEB3049959.1 hypothetical protein [Mycolicibacter sp. MYC123]MEB3062325.1 hypothetical protein [Mycolicibacter sp. MYC101]
MKHIAWGIVIGGAAAAAFAGSGVANADPASWTPSYDVDGAQLFAGLPTLGQEAWSPAWELPVSFTSSDGTTLTGTDYITASSGGFNDEFITKDGATYDQNQLLPGFTNLYYDPAGDGTAVDVMKTPFGNVDLSSMASTFAPPELPTVNAETVGHNIVVADGAIYRIGEAIGLSDKTGVAAAGGLTDPATITTLQTPESSLVWAAPAAYTDHSGVDATTLTGNLYVTSPTDVEFVDQAGDVFDQHTLVSGLFFVENLYYDPVNGPAVDKALTPFGLVDLSSVASWFAPADVSDLSVTPSPVSDLADAGLYSALDLGLPS